VNIHLLFSPFILTENQREGKWLLQTLAKGLCQIHLKAGFAGSGVLNEDPMVWLDGAGPPPISFMALPWSENEFSNAIIWQTHYL
jgi:hypothetical protein